MVGEEKASSRSGGEGERVFGGAGAGGAGDDDADRNRDGTRRRTGRGSPWVHEERGERREAAGGGGGEEGKPVGLLNIDSNHVSSAIHLAAIERRYNEVTNTQLWEHANNHTGTKGRMEERHMMEILSAMELEKVPGASSGDALAILEHLRGKEGYKGQGWYWECQCGWKKFEKTERGVVRIEGS